MKLNEVLDTQVKLNWPEPVSTDIGSGVASFYIKDKEFLISFDEHTEGEWEVAFIMTQENGRAVAKDGITGSGDQYAIFATVINAILQFLKEIDPPVMWFTASEPSRAKLYARIADNISKQTNRTLRTVLTSSGKKFILVQNVTKTIPPKLYHATYAPLMKSIKTEGLGGSSAEAKWEDSVRGVVYLADSPEVAESYAESSDIVDEDWLDNIVMFEILTKDLNTNNIRKDSNVIDGDTTYEYHGVIPFSALRIVR